VQPANPSSARRGSRAPSAQLERTAVLSALQPVVAMLGRMMGPHVEVVLHDLTRPEHSVVAIANGHLSGREPGSSILSGPQDDIAFAAALRETRVRGEPSHTVIEGYPTLTRDGKRLQSATVVFRDAAGIPYAALCVNADLHLFQQIRSWLDAFLPGAQEEPGRPELLAPLGGPDAKRQVRGLPPEVPNRPKPAVPTGPTADVQAVVKEALQHLGKPVADLDRAERQAIVQTLLHRGLFVIRGGVEQAARALGVSRYTIYNDAKALQAATAQRQERH